MNTTASTNKINQTTRKVTSLVGIFLAIAGFEHGLFAALQGNKPTNGYIIQAIGEDMQWWIYGGEEAFTLIPNFLITGITAMIISVFIMLWSVYFISGPYGTTVFIIAFILLLLTGGGIGFILFFIPAWAYSRNIRSSLNWWKRNLPSGRINTLSRMWKTSLTITIVFWLIALEIAIFGYVPGTNDPDQLLSICWGSLGIAFVFMNVSFIAGYAKDIQE